MDKATLKSRKESISEKLTKLKRLDKKLQYADLMILTGKLKSFDSEEYYDLAGRMSDAIYDLTLQNCKFLFIKYTNVDGEREYCGHSVLITSKRKNNENAVHEHFLDFWGTGQCDRRDSTKLSWYLYMAGQVGVKSIIYQEITKEEFDVLKKLGIAH